MKKRGQARKESMTIQLDSLNDKARFPDIDYNFKLGSTPKNYPVFSKQAINLPTSTRAMSVTRGSRNEIGQALPQAAWPTARANDSIIGNSIEHSGQYQTVA